jgi:4-diphosphocytidyl-2-C-methyl-D-erythritol kinase
MRLRAYAKINLDLRILNLRPDGYHDISTVFQSISLHDTVTVEETAGGVSVTCDDERVPRGDANVCAWAVRALWATCGREGEPGGVRVHIAKQVPMAAGLGGGSADAAAVLEALARLWGVPETDPRIHQAAESVGADVPYFLVGGTALGTGKGDRLVPLRDVRPSELVIVQPPFGVVTAEAYRWYDELRGAESQGTLAASIRAGRVLSLCQNQLERPVAIRRPAIGDVCARLRVLDARLAAMSGSGSAVFGLFDTAGQADAAAEAMGDPSHRVMRARFVDRRAYRDGRFVES